MEIKEPRLEAEFFNDSNCFCNSPEFKFAGPFRIGRFLGKGTSGTAFVGTHIETGFKAALKAIKKSNLAKKPARWKQLRREIAVMKLMDHPNILKLYDVFETEDRIWMVTELARGGELFDYLQRGIPSRKTCLRFLAQITMGLLHCHQHGITHRDLKPENLLLDERLNIKVADFGMARFTAKGTFMNTTCGSPHYVSPEVICGKYEGKTSDVWSLGVILYALCTGCLPFDHESIPELLKLIQAGVFSIPSDVDDDIADLIRRMMQVDVKDRILMEDIQAHQAFAGTWYFSKPPLLPESPESVLSSKTVDENAFEDVIALLGSDSRTEIREKVTNSADSLEKALYRLLLNRKHHRLANLHRLSPKTTYRSMSPSSPSFLASELPPSFDLGVQVKEKEVSKVTSSSLSQSASKPEFSDLLTQTFLKINMLESKETSTPPPGHGSSPQSAKISSTPSTTRRLSSHSKMEVTAIGKAEVKPLSISPELPGRRISLQIDQRMETRDPIRTSVLGPIDLKPSPNVSPFITPIPSPHGSPTSSPPPSRAPSPSRRVVSPSSPVTRPWFAAFFKRRPSMDPYKPDSGSTSNASAAVRASILHRLRARASQSSPRKIEVESRPFRGSLDHEIPDSVPSPKLSARLEGLLKAAQIPHTPPQSQSQPPFKTSLPVLQEEGRDTPKGT